MKKYGLKPFFKAMGLSFLLISDFAHNNLQAAEVVPTSGNAMSSIDGNIREILSSIVPVAVYCFGLEDSIPVVIRSLVVSVYQQLSNQIHGIKPLLKHFTRNALLLQFFTTVQAVVNEDSFLSDESRTMGYSNVFKIIATMVVISIALQRYLCIGGVLRDAFMSVTNLTVREIKFLVSTASGIITFLFKQFRSMNPIKMLFFLGTSAIVFCHEAIRSHLLSSLGWLPMPTLDSMNWCVKFEVLNQLAQQPNNALDRDIEDVASLSKKLLNQGREQICLHKKEIKTAAYKFICFLTELMSQLLEPMAAIFSR